MPVAPFPWHALPRVAASEVLAFSALRAGHPGVSPTSIAGLLAELIGHAVVVEPRRRACVPVARLDLGARGTCTLLGRDGQGLAIEIEAELALAVVGALAGARGLPRVARARQVEPEVAGALASVVLHVVRATAGDEFAIEGIDVTPDDARAWLSRGGAEVMTLDAGVRIGALKALARVAITVPRSSAPERLPPASVLALLGDAPLSLPVVLACGWAPRRELALAEGDVAVVDGLARDGRCVLADPDARSGVAAWWLDAARLRLDLARVDLAAEPAPVEAFDPPMSDSTNQGGETVEVPIYGEGNALADALADLPLEVRVEAGTVTLPARAWAAMGQGDVVVLDRRVGESVVLRVGGKVVGRGELVDVDGQLGVRLLERLS